jgi:hypothetical protein
VYLCGLFLLCCFTLPQLASGATPRAGPKITRFTATPKNLTNLGGKLTVVIRASRTSKCELRVSPSARHGSLRSCSARVTVTLPKNKGAIAESFTLRLTALARSKQATKTVRVSVAGHASGAVTTAPPTRGTAKADAYPFGIGLASVYQANCALLASGDVRCWGSNRDGVLGNGVTGIENPGTVTVQGISDAIGLASDGSSFCAWLVGGEAKCWGADLAGELGDGTSAALAAGSSAAPVQVQGLSNVVSIVGSSSGSGYAPAIFCAVLATGGVTCWGENSQGELGDGGPEQYSVIPVKVVGISDATAVATDGYGFCATHATGAVSCWGDDRLGELGDGQVTGSYSNEPVTVSGLANAISLIGNTTGGYCALLTSGGAKCWGSNVVSGNLVAGRLGDGGNEVQADVPVPVAGLSGATSLIDGDDGTCALLSSGGARCWGVDVGIGCTGCGDELGDGGTEVASTVPVAVSGLSDAISLTSDGGGYCAVLQTGGLACWGAVFGGSGLNVATPVGGLSQIVAMSYNGSGDCVLLGDGGVKCWGYAYGADGTASAAAEAVPIAGLGPPGQ